MMGGPRTESVEDQAEAGGDVEPGQPLAAVVVKRRSLELARIDVLSQLGRARADAHRQMLERALQALDHELERLV